jgi:two-component system chemotaxis sensor kinase CheA
MADKMDTNQYLGAFLDEAGDNLEHLNELLLSAEQNQSDMDIINEIFRVAHTFKGMAATMGFQSMAALTHAMEDVLGLVRSGNLLLTSDDVDILFKCLDTLTAMVDSIRGGHSDADVESDHLTKVLHARRDHPEGAIADAVPDAQEFIEEKPLSGAHAVASHFTDQELDWIASADASGMQVYELKVTLDENCMLRAARAYMVVTLVGDLGDIIKTVPVVEDLEKEAFERDFTIYVASRDTLENITSQVERVGEVAEVKGTEMDIKKLKSAAEETPPQAGHQDAAPSSKAPEEPAEKKPAEPPHADEHQKTAADAKKDASKAGSRTVRVDIGRSTN